MDIEQARFNMIEQQIRPWDVLDINVLNIIEQTPRELFAPKELKNLAFSDLEIPLSHEQAMMTPKVEARMLQALQINPNDEILEIGTGSGFITACLAKLGAHVDSIEYYSDLSEHAQSVADQLNIDNINFMHGDALNDLNSAKQYDAIVITASMPSYTDNFEQLLTNNGRIFVVTGKAPVMQAQLMTKIDSYGVRNEQLFETNLKPLIGSKEPQVFQI